MESDPTSSVETDGGTYIAGDVATNGGGIIGRDLQVVGDKVAGDKVEGDQIDAGAAKGFINRPTAPVTQHFGNTLNLGSWKIPKPVAGMLLTGCVAVVLLIGVNVLYMRGTFQAITAPTPTSTPTISTATPTRTPLPTATALAFATEAPDETLILIANFLVTAGNRNTLAHREIQEQIFALVEKLNQPKVRVEIEPAVLESNQRAQAETLGQRYRASMVIWGDDTGIRMTVNFLNLRQPDFTAATVTIRETVRTQLANPSAYAQFVIDDLPRQLIFLTLFAVGQSYYSHQDYPQAIAVTESAINSLQGKNAPTGLADAYFRLGWLYQQPPAKLDQAIGNYDHAITFRPDYAAAYNNRGNIYYAQGKLDTAIADYDQAIELDPSLAFPHNNRGIAHHDQGKLDAAMVDYDQALLLQPDYAEAYYNRGIVHYAQGQLDAAIADYDQAITLQPSLAFAYNNRGFARADQGKLDEAIADYSQAIQLDPTYALPYINRGVARYIQGQLDGEIADYGPAIADYDKGIALDPNYALAYLYRSDALAAQGKLAEASADYRRYLQLHPDASN